MLGAKNVCSVCGACGANGAAPSAATRDEVVIEHDDGIWSLYFCNVLLGRIDERKALVKGQLGVTHVPG